MPIITLVEAKTLLQISGSTYDSLINMLIPIVETAVADYCNNHFIDSYKSINGILPTVYTYSNTVEFLNSDNSYNDTQNDLTILNFKVGDIVRFYNSLHNDNFYTISSIATSKIVLDSLRTITDDDTSNTIITARAIFPEPTKLTASHMIKFNLQKYGVLFKGEKIDDYSYSRSEDLEYGYPKGIMNQLNCYRSMMLKEVPYNLIYYRNE